jgi:dihydrolipoamide dehydrogenase
MGVDFADRSAMNKNFDVLILGAGTAGLAAMRAVRQRTENFAVVNDGPYGTTCARVGCMPSKTLIEAANTYHQRCHFSAMGIRGSGALCVDIPAVMRRVRELRDHFVRSVLRITDSLGQRNIPGRARFVDAHTVEVDGTRLQAERIIIATGSHPFVPQEWRSLGQAVLTTDDLFELNDLPARMAVVGLGGVGAETAQALSRLGIEVTAFEAVREIAGLSDPVVNACAVAALGEELQLVLGAKTDLRKNNGGVCITADGTSVIVRKVLVAVGRRPNLQDLGLEALGIELDEQGVPIFDPTTMQIGDLPIYIAGDANADAPLLHEAADEGFIAGHNALRREPQCFERRTPLAIFFTSPNIAVVGRSFADLQDADVAIGKVDLGNQGRLRMSNRNRGCLRVYAEQESGRLLGAELCAPEGEHLAHLLALAIDREMTLTDLLRLPFYHPVAEEGLRTALRDAAGKLPRRAGPDLATCDPPGAEALG